MLPPPPPTTSTLLLLLLVHLPRRGGRGAPLGGHEDVLKGDLRLVVESDECFFF